MLRITPAYAGRITIDYGLDMLAWDHPRIRGKNAEIKAVKEQIQGSPPHTREESSAELIKLGGIEDHPRIRGKNAFLHLFVVSVLGSPPHTREELKKAVFYLNRMRITPAYAGRITIDYGLDMLAWDHPRIRGKNRAFKLSHSVD